MSLLSSKGFSLVETLVASALVAMWAVSSQQLLQVGLAAIKRAELKAQAVEVLNSYIQSIHIAWSNGSYPPTETTENGFTIISNVNSLDEDNATVDIKISRGERRFYSVETWLSR
ncbi:type II secretion system protein [Idiomarina piscisalsi]|uniref:type II secretion system protein n=1 Tax=Idiomarina piscisalsi TaxID=1096243 RepID=UPI00137C7D21|nr:type II secretion system protein [Idiomarina piscisalsi]MTJ01030.1 type II secretion system protein [Idiomarina piscisalsi]